METVKRSEDYFSYNPDTKQKYRCKYESNGLPFSDPLGASIIQLRERIQLKKASVVIIDGGVGEGKSTLAVEVAEMYQGKDLNFEEQYAVGSQQFIKKLDICITNGHGVIIFDEAGEFSRRAAMSKLNARLNRIFETFRTYKILVILVLPTFMDLDSSLFTKNIPRVLLHVHSRGKNYGNFMAYSLTRIHRLRYYAPRLMYVQEVFKYNSPNFVGHFLNLPAHKCNKLDEICTLEKRKILKKSNREESQLISSLEIGETLGYDTRRIREVIKLLNIEPESKEGNLRYYKKGTLERVRAALND